MVSIGGRTDLKLGDYELHIVTHLAPDVVILEISTNDLSQLEPELVASKIEVFLSLLRDKFFVRIIGIILVPRAVLFLVTWSAKRGALDAANTGCQEFSDIW